MFFTKLFLVLSILIIVLAGCKKNNIIQEEKFINVYTDIIIARDTTPVNLNNEIINGVLMKWDVTPEEYKATIDYYNQESSRWEDFFTKAVKHLEEKREQASD